jgi:hypothetical protein
VKEAGALLVSGAGRRRWGTLGGHARCAFASTVAEATERLRLGVGLVVTDVSFADGTCDILFEQARSLELPPVFVIVHGELLPEPLIRLIEEHAREPASERVASSLPAEDALVAAASRGVGRLGVREAQDVVRRTMYSEALARTKGSRKAAARLLRVDRRAVQRIAADLDSA